MHVRTYACMQHRYYGESLPYGSKDVAYNKSLVGYLTTTQALADYAALILDLKNNLSSQSSPVVLFGGSYGGSEFASINSFLCRSLCGLLLHISMLAFN